MLAPDLSDSPDPQQLRQLHEYWLSLAGGEAPERHQIDPGAIRAMLPYLCIVEFEDQPFRVRYRLSGTKVDALNGYTVAGRYLDDMIKDDPSGGGDHILKHYKKCWETGQPSFSTYRWPTRSGNHLDVTFAMFPLKVDGAIRQCLGIESWEYSFEPIAEEAVPLAPALEKPKEK